MREEIDYFRGKTGLAVTFGSIDYEHLSNVASEQGCTPNQLIHRIVRGVVNPNGPREFVENLCQEYKGEQ